MIPKLFEIGPISINSYGLMLGIAFLVASYLFTSEFKRKGIYPDIANEITLLAILFGILGAKINHLFTIWPLFIKDPLGELFSPGGLTFHGGFILAILVIIIAAKKRRIPFLVLADLAAPSIAVAYGIARIGCHLSGDGDYGLPVSELFSWVPWGTDYSNGTYPPSYAFRGTELAAKYPGGMVPDNTLCHPTPIYELILALILFSFLWKIRKNERPIGVLFSYLLIFHGLSRFIIEFIRLNPYIFLKFTEAQLVAIGMIIIGLIIKSYMKKHPDAIKFDPALINYKPKVKEKKK